MKDMLEGSTVTVREKTVDKDVNVTEMDIRYTCMSHRKNACQRLPSRDLM